MGDHGTKDLEMSRARERAGLRRVNSSLPRLVCLGRHASYLCNTAVQGAYCSRDGDDFLICNLAQALGDL